MASKVSFTVRRPTPVSRASSTGASSDGGSSFKVPALPRHLTNDSVPGSPLGRHGDGGGSRGGSPKVKARTYDERDSSDEDEVIEDELVTGFDQFGVQRLHEKPKPAGPLVIPALQNRDWRELARKRKTANLYVPPSGAATTGADGSVGGLGTRDTINSGPQLSGLQVGSNKRMKTEDVDMEEEATPPPPSTVQAKTEETEDQKALRLLLAGDDPSEGQIIDIIPPPSEDEAYRQDVVELPDSATLDDYDRVPVSQFGAALLRGMGWKEGEAATRRVGKNGEKKGMVEPWLPTSRPALLGIGAKEKEALDDGSSLGKKGGVTKKRGKPDTKYMPLLKVEKRGGDDRDSRERESRSGSSSRRRSPEPEERKCSRRSSPDPDRRRDRDRDYDRDKDRRGEDRYRERDRDRDREDKYRERDRDDRDKDRKRERERDYESSSRRDRDRDDHRRRDRDRERSPDRSRR